MGLAKTEWMEAQERGWEAPEKSVCPDCVDDDHLKAVIRRSLTSLTCAFCYGRSWTSFFQPRKRWCAI